MRDGHGSSSATFLGSASGIHFIRSVYGAIGTPATNGTTPGNDVVPGEDDRLTSEASIERNNAIWHDHEVRNEPASNSTFDELTEWTGSYFDLWHPAFPLLHAPSVLENLETISQGNLSRLQPWDVTVIKAITSLSSADRRQSGVQVARPPPRELLFHTFDDALTSLQPALIRPATIAGLQAIVCVQLFLVSMLRLNAASRVGGLIVQMAFQLGLHRCPVRFESFTSEDQQLRKRLFWSIYCIEKYVCQALGLPLTLRDEDIDVCHLNTERHGLVNHKPRPDILDGRLQVLSFLARHAQIRASIIELRNKNIEERDRSPDTATFITARLTQWWNEVEDFLDQLETLEISDFHRVVLETTKHESIIMLNRPLLALPKHTAGHASAIHACISAAKSLLICLTSRTSNDIPSSSHKPHLALVWPSFTWGAWMSAFILLYGAAEGKVGHTAAVRNVDRSLKILDRLAARGSVWPQACAVAVEDLRSILNQRQGNPAQDPSSANSIRSGTFPFDKTNEISNQHASKPSFDPRLSPQASANAAGSRSVMANRRSSHTQVRTLARVPSSPSNNRSDFQNLTSNIERRDSQAMSQDFANLNPSSTLNSFHQEKLLGSSGLTAALPPMSLGESDPFQGFDIPFWFGQDNYLAWAGDKS